MQRINENVDKLDTFPYRPIIFTLKKKDTGLFEKPKKALNPPDKCIYVHIRKFAYPGD